MSHISSIILRGDHACYRQVDGRFPYLDHAAAAGATGVHVWFWGEPFIAVAHDFLAACVERNLGVHLGIGLGAYGVCDGEDPLDPAVQRRIQGHLDRTLDTYHLAGVELQTGEYDRVEFAGGGDRRSHAQRICETLNPYVEHLCRRDPSLWVRTELNAEFCPPEQHGEVARLIDPRCTVEWSRFTGPFQGGDALARGRRLLSLAGNFSWFLKVLYRRDHYWRELIPSGTSAEQDAWIAHWRGWIGTLRDLGRTTLTICNVDDAYPSIDPRLTAAAVALARDPDLPADEVQRRFFAGAGFLASS